MGIFNDSYNTYQKKTFLKIADVVSSPSGYVLGAERNISKESLDPVRDWIVSESKAEEFSDKEFEKGVMDSSILFVSNAEKTMIWKRPAALAKMFFAKSLKDFPKECELMQPNLIFKLVDSNLSVFAYVQYNGEDTELYHSPYMNVNSKSICMGSSNVDTSVSTWNELKTNAEYAFFYSEFTHFWGKAIQDEYDYASIISNQLRDNSSFPVDALIKLPITLKSLF
jgi:PRTRC genetic system protein B